MGKYKQWLHHQEIGRRLRDQINTLEQERTRVQQMAPEHAASLPPLDNPMIAAMQSFTRAGNKLSNVDVIQAAMPDIGPDPIKGTAATASATARPAASTTNDAVVASLLTRAEQMPSDPLQQMHELAHTSDGAAVTPTATPAAESVNDWWQQRRRQDAQD